MPIETVRRATAFALAVLGIGIVIVLFTAIWQNRFDPVLTKLVLSNFPVIIGLPAASVAAFIVVAIFRQTENPLEFEGLGFKFKGAAGEIVLWTGCFLAVVGSIWLLWKQ